ncbi:MAG: Holliday junction branch migration protein RuvA [Bdellovibrionota bacterium]
MIARLKGTLEEKSKNTVIVDVQGVGYGLHVPETVFLRMPEAGGEVILQVHTHVREDHITLYGFLSKLEKDVFEILMSASGVGPKLALTILSALEASQVIEAVSQGNKVLFNGISGVGKKTVEKLFVEIREKCEKRLLLERGGGEATAKRGAASSSIASSASWVNDLEQALLGLGYKEGDVRLALREVTGHDSAHRDFDTALRSALSYLSGGLKQSLRGNA